MKRDWVSYWHGLLRRHMRYLMISLLNVVCVGALCYLDSNVRYSMGGEMSLYAKLESRRRLLNLEKDKAWMDSVLLIDVAYDQMLVPATNELGDTIGTCCITDRRKLTELLGEIRKANNYKMVMLDMNFANDIFTDCDSALYATILQMPRIFIPRHRDATMADTLLYRKAGYSDYGITFFENSFVKYEFLQEGKPSMPLLMSGKELTSWGPLCFSHGRLCYNCMPIAMQLCVHSKESECFQNMGADMLENRELIPLMTEGRIVLIGNMQTDVQSTYNGKIPGPVISMNAYNALVNGMHLVDFRVSALWGVMYIILSMLVLKGRSLLHYIPWVKRVRSDVVGFALSMFSFSVVISLVASLLYLCTGHISNIALPSMYFSIFTLIINFKRRKYEKVI